MIAKMLRRDLLKMGAGVLATSWATHALAITTTRPNVHYPERVILFPRKMGWIPLSKDFSSDNMVEAHGDVTVPEGVPARLFLLGDNRNAVPWLRALNPDDLDELLCWLAGGTVCFDDLAHLSGLRTLEFTDTAVEGIIDLSRFPLLTELVLYGTGVSEARIVAMRRDFPRIRIDYQR